MIRNALLIVILTLTTPSLAYRVSHNLESCYFHSPTIVVGKVIAVQNTEPRKIKHESTRGYVFPHAEARILISEVVKNHTDRPIAPGDTIRMYYATDHRGVDPRNPESNMDCSPLKKPDLHPGDAGAFNLRETFGEWRSACFQHHSEPENLPRIREIARELGAENWAKRAPVIVVARVVAREQPHDRAVKVDGEPGWVARHVTASVAIESVLKNNSGIEISPGDSLDVIARVGRMAHRVDDEGVTTSTEYFRQPVEPGYTELLAIRLIDGQWHEGTFCPHRELGLIPSLQNILSQSSD